MALPKRTQLKRVQFRCAARKRPSPEVMERAFANILRTSPLTPTLESIASSDLPQGRPKPILSLI